MGDYKVIKAYHSWSGIKQRCYNKKSTAYVNYGGRGIGMYDRWRDSFEAFYDDVSKLPHCGEEGYTLDRIDNNGNYEPNNVRWATDVEQANNRRNNRILNYDGKSQTMAQWAEELNIPTYVLFKRLSLGWSVEKTLSTPRYKGLTYKGKTQTAVQWAKELNIKVQTIYKRLNSGWSVEKTLSTPTRLPIRQRINK